MESSTLKRRVLTEKEHLMCDYCESNVATGVYCSNFGPISLAQCDECLNYCMATLRYGLMLWARHGDKRFVPMLNPKRTMTVFYKENYHPMNDVIRAITIEEVENLFSEGANRDLIIKKIQERDVPL